MSKKIYTALILIMVFLGLSLNFHPVKIQASTSSVSFDAWAWSDNVGWINLKSSGEGTCDPNSNGVFEGVSEGANPLFCPQSGTAIQYSVDIDSAGNISGYGWSDNVGWISFNEPGCPSGPGTCQAKINGNQVTGWAKVLSGDQVSDDGWDGWISLGTQSGDTSSYGITLQQDTKKQGYFWGSDILGWLKSYATLGNTDVCSPYPATHKDGAGNCVCNESTAINPPTCTSTVVITPLATQSYTLFPHVVPPQTDPSAKPCTLAWTLNDGGTAPISCQVDNETPILYTSTEINSSPISVGTHTLKCTDSSPTPQTVEFTSPIKPTCRVNPNYGEF